MTQVLLVNQGPIPHYRVHVYEYLSRYLRNCGFELSVAASGVQSDGSHRLSFPYVQMELSLPNLVGWVCRHGIDIVIFWVNLRHLYLLPTCAILKTVLRKKVVYWGHGRDLARTDSTMKNLGYALQQSMSDSIILYADHLKKYVHPSFHRKTFVANNTLYLDYPGLAPERRPLVLAEYGIRTRKNIICVGRIQKRKRLDHLMRAFSTMNRPDLGLILVGPDEDGTLEEFEGDNIYKLGPVYGVKKFDLLSAADVCCIPGAVGLSIVDAFHSGLPLVTESGDESPEIMYLKDGINGFAVPRGDTAKMAEKLVLLLDNDDLRMRFSRAAAEEIRKNGHIDKLCAGFRDALFHAALPPGP